MRHLGLVTPIAAPPPRPRAERSVGIWRADAGEGAFVRDGCADEVSLWADVERIGPEGAQKRVAFLGESVARGYFHDPEYTPAMALEARGNNWLPVVNATRDRVELSPLVRDGSLLDVRAYLEERPRGARELVRADAGRHLRAHGRPGRDRRPDALLELADDLELGETPDSHPVLGEVHVLRASVAES